jgi:hypothetical protein
MLGDRLLVMKNDDKKGKMSKTSFVAHHLMKFS